MSKQQAFCSFSFSHVRGETSCFVLYLQICVSTGQNPVVERTGFDGLTLLHVDEWISFFLCYLAASSTQTRGLSHCLLSHICRAFHSQMEIPDPHHCQFRTGCSAVWQVAELPLNFPDASQDSQAENEVLLSSVGLLCRSALWPLAGCKCRDTSAGRLAASWSDGALVKTLSQPCLWWQSWACAFVTPPLRWLAEPVKYMVVPNVSSFTVAALKHESLYSRG